MKSLFFAMIITVFLINPTTYAQMPDVPDLSYMTEEYPPANYMEYDTLKGASVEILRLLWQKMGYPAQSIRVVPWARGYKTVQDEKNTVLFTMSRTPEREILFKWVGPIFMARHVLVALEKKAITLHSLDEAKKYTAGVIRADIGEISLREAGYPPEKIEPATDMEQNFNKLIQGRVDLICVSDDALRRMIDIKRYDPKLFRTVFVVNEIGNFYAFNRDTPESLIKKFQDALGSVRKEHLAILKRYGMGL